MSARTSPANYPSAGENSKILGLGRDTLQRRTNSSLIALLRVITEEIVEMVRAFLSRGGCDVSNRFRSSRNHYAQGRERERE